MVQLHHLPLWVDVNVVDRFDGESIVVTGHVVVDDERLLFLFLFQLASSVNCSSHSIERMAEVLG